MKKNQILLATARLVMSEALTKNEGKEVEKNPFAPEPIAFTNPYEGLAECKYTPTFNSVKSRKCSNKKYVKRKKSKNGR